MSASRNATMLVEQGMRVLIHQLMQDDRERQQRVITGLAFNAVRPEQEMCELWRVS